MKSLRAINAEGEKVYTTEAKWKRLKDQLLKTLKDFHAGHPLVPGMDMEELRGKLVYDTVAENLSRRHRTIHQRESSSPRKKTCCAWRAIKFSSAARKQS